MKDPKKFAKAKKISMDKNELIREHKHLVAVLRSPSHKDDKVEAKKQAKELKEYTSKSEDSASQIGCGTGLAGKICRHNNKKLNHFVEAHKKMKKSVDFKDTLVSVDAKDQLLAEQTTNPILIKYIQNNIDAQAINKTTSSARIPFPTGVLTLTAREAGIYNGFFQDMDGQVVEKFDAQTAAIIAKTLQLKSLVPDPVEPQGVPVAAPSESPSTSEIVASQAHDRIDMVHDRIDSLQRQLIEQQRGKSIRIKYGDFELEIKKSLQGFISDFKAGRALPDKDVVRKAITSWRKKNADYMPLSNDQQAARELMENWEQHQDGFCQFVDAISRGDDEQD